MITFSRTAVSKLNREGLVTKFLGTVVSLPSASTQPVINLTVPRVCCACFDVYGGGSNDYQNDKSSFLYKGFNATGVVIKLFKDGEELITLDASANLGTYYPFGTWNYADQENYVGYVINWDAVYQAHGIGCYFIRAERTVLGNSENIDSREFSLGLYDDTKADKSVTFKWVQNGNIKSSEFDYTGMEWTQYIRIDGRLSNWEPTLEKDEIVYSNYETIQVQDEIRNTYSFESHLVDSSTTEALTLDMMLANDIYITDFNAYNHRTYVDLNVRQEEVSVEEIQGGTDAVITLKFSDKIKNVIKRN